MGYRILKYDPYLEPHAQDLALRMENYLSKRTELIGKAGKLTDFANGYQYFGIHPTKTGWVYREWAPAAQAMFFTGDFNNWDTYALPMKRLENGVFELYLDGKDA